MMPRCAVRLRLLVLITGGLAACASQTPAPSHPGARTAALPGKDACFWTRSLEDWTVLDDSTLIVHAPLAQDAYLVKLFAPITGLAFHERLGFEGGDGDPGQICSQNAYVVAGGEIPQREPITAVRALTPGDAKKMLSTAGSAASHRQKPPAPPPSS